MFAFGLTRAACLYQTRSYLTDKPVYLGRLHAAGPIFRPRVHLGNGGAA